MARSIHPRESARTGETRPAYMTLRPALAGVAIFALLLTGCASTPKSDAGSFSTASGDAEVTPTPTPTVTTEPAPAPVNAPVVDPTVAPIPLVTSIVLHPNTIDFLAADGTTVDSANLSGSADEAAKAISDVLKTPPTVETIDQAWCGAPGKTRTWPGGLLLIELTDAYSSWTPVPSQFIVTLHGSGHGDVTFEGAGGYKIGDHIPDAAGVPGTQIYAVDDSPPTTWQKFAAELNDPKAPEHQAWGVIVSSTNNVVDVVSTPWHLIGDC
jgi:hypothetical protein